MLRQGIVCLIGLLLTNVATSDEPVRPTNPQTQRVSPKLLREALALPETKARTQEVPAVSLDDLKRLAEKLKTNGHTEDAELLQRFVHEHQPQTAEVAVYAGAQNEVFNIQCDVVEVNVEDLPANSVAVDGNCASRIKELQAELHRLVSLKKAKAIIEHLMIPIKASETGRARSGGQFPVPIPSSDGTVPVEFREFGTVVETSATPIAKDRVRIQISTETSTKDTDNAITIGGATIPGITKRKTQSVIEANLGETVVQASPATIKGHRQFVLVKVTTNN